MLKQAFGEPLLVVPKLLSGHGLKMAESVDNDEHSGQPPSNTQLKMLKKFSRPIIISRRSMSYYPWHLQYCWDKLWDLSANSNTGMSTHCRQVCAQAQKQHQILVCQKLKYLATINHNFLPKVITGDESWVYRYNQETKHRRWCLTGRHRKSSRDAYWLAAVLRSVSWLPGGLLWGW